MVTAIKLAAKKRSKPRIRRVVPFPKAGAELRKRRNDLGLTLRDCAEPGMSVSGISRAESGLEPSLPIALRLARFYETTVEQIWGAEFKP